MAWQHLKVHLLMLSLAIQTSNKREFVGQIARSLLAVPGTLSGRYPTGNPGSSDVSMFEVCDIPAEICEQFEGEKSEVVLFQVVSFGLSVSILRQVSGKGFRNAS